MRVAVETGHRPLLADCSHIGCHLTHSLTVMESLEEWRHCLKTLFTVLVMILTPNFHEVSHEFSLVLYNK